MKLAKSFLAVAIALLLVVCPLLQPMNASAAETNGKISLSYRYGTSTLIQVNTNLPSDTPCVNFTTNDNGCNIDQTGNTVQWIGWVGMNNVNGTIVLTFQFNNAFAAGQSYVLPKGAVFGFTDGKTYALDGDYSFDFDGSSWSMNVQNNVETVDFTYRWGANDVIQFNTNLPSNTPCVNFLATDNGCNISQTGTQFGWAGMDNVDGAIVITLHFNAGFEVGQSYTLGAGSVFGFTDGNKYVLPADVTLYWDGANWTTQAPVQNITLAYRYGAANLIQFNTNLPATTPCVNFLASDNGCNLDQKGDQQVGWIQMIDVEGTIVLTFHFNGSFAVGQSYTLGAGSVFGFTDGKTYPMDETVTLYWDGSNWGTEAPHIHNYESVVTAPTATKEGYTTHTCSGCGDSYVDSTVPAIGIGELRFSSGFLTLKDNLNVNFKVPADLFIEDAYTAPYVVFNVGIKTQTVTNYNVVDGTYVFTCTNLAPSQAGDVITATLYATLNGEVQSCTMEYSVAQYCYNMLGKTEDAKLRTLLVDLLNYGAAAQTYAWYNDKTLCNANLTAEQKAWGTQSFPALESKLNTKAVEIENPKATWKTAGLVLENSVTMRLRFAAESIEGLTVKVANGDQEWIISEFTAAEKAGQYYVYFNGLAARQMRDVVSVTLYEGDTAVSNTVEYSIETYAHNKQNEARLGDLVIAMMKYGDSAAAYLN